MLLGFKSHRIFSYHFAQNHLAEALTFRPVKGGRRPELLPPAVAKAPPGNRHPAGPTPPSEVVRLSEADAFLDVSAPQGRMDCRLGEAAYVERRNPVKSLFNTFLQGKVTYGSVLGLAVCWVLDHFLGVPIPREVYASLAATTVVGIRRAQARVEAAVNQIVPPDPNAK